MRIKLELQFDSSPGSLAEEEFLQRCIRCGECMRVCPTNVLQPGGSGDGLETLWTPALNNRIGSSGCQLNCVACGKACPTAAIRPISLDEKLGRGVFAETGPIRLGAAFVDHGRCLPWAMDKPCIVCQENCPVSPKAINVREVFKTIRNGALKIEEVHGEVLGFASAVPNNGHCAGGDFSCLLPRGERVAIEASTTNSITLATRQKPSPPTVGQTVEIQVCLQQPYVDVRACIGCGICEHECPVSGRRAIRVSAENESRDPHRRLLL